MLFSPIRIGTVSLKNRCVVPAMATNYARDDGSLSERQIAYYSTRARGGFGLIITELTAVAPIKALQRQLGLWDDKYIPGWEKLASVVHDYGAKLAPQLHSAGNKALLTGSSNAEVLGPSPISYAPARGKVTGLDSPIAKEFTAEDIESTVEAFGEAARRARDAGCDAVEIHGAHGYLFAQFMSPAENKRIDNYGGTVDGRVRLALDVINRIRSKVGRDFPILWKISADELLPGGLTIEETRLIAWLLTRAGVDCIHVSQGSITHSHHWTVPPSHAPLATWTVRNTLLIKQATNVPVIAVGRIIDPLMAEFLLETGNADLVAFGRASIADPELPNKAAAGRFEDIRGCLGCNTCTDSVRTGNFDLRCAMNPELGRELEMLPLVPATNAKKILVGGGGPGGLELARVAAQRGHQVTLYEKSERLGGQLWIGALAPGKQQVTYGLRWLLREAKKAGVRIELGQELTPDLVQDLRPDVLIVATGGTPVVPQDIPGIGKSIVATAVDVLAEKVRCGSRVLVLGANLIGCEVADWLGFHRKEVTLVKMRPGAEIGVDVSTYVRPWLIDRLENWKVRVVAGSKEGVRIKRIDDDGVVIVRDGHEEILLADTVVLALGVRSVSQLVEQAEGRVAEVYVIGDAKKPRGAADAISEGALIARRV